MMTDKLTLVDDEELERYRNSVQSYLDGDIDAERFQSIRLQQGIYAQRQADVNMVRIKMPGGRLNPQQARTIADTASRFSRIGTAHITTRQSIQLHYVPLEDTPAVIRRLATAELTTREACNNTVRNITACPLAGVCPAEHTDVNRFVQTATHHFLRHPLTQHLPRKFKISFSGCEQDCAQGVIHDLAIIAVRDQGRFGFRVLAGGGLGNKPRKAIVVEEFVEPRDLLASMEAVIAVHNRYSNRRLRAKSRSKFLIERFGAEGFIDKYRQELERTRVVLADAEIIHGQWHEQTKTVNGDPGAPRDILPQKQPGQNIVPLHIAAGDITMPQLHGIADIMDEMGLEDLRTTQDQNLMIIGVGEALLDTLVKRIRDIGLDIPHRGSNVVACPGTETCRLGITASKTLAAMISGGGHDLRIRVSGCHNGCAQPETGDIGLYGEGNRRHGHLIPCYQLIIGGDGRGSRGPGFKTRSVPSARIETAISDIENAYHDDHHNGESFHSWSHRRGKTFFDDLLREHAAIDAASINEVLMDHGQTDRFHVVQFGGGECAGAAQETVAANFAEAANENRYRDAYLSRRRYSESMQSATRSLRLIANALLLQCGHSPIDDLNSLARQLEIAVGDEEKAGPVLARIAGTLAELEKEFDPERYCDLLGEIDRWSLRAAALSQNMDRQLDLGYSLPESSEAKTGNETVVVDLSSYGCPLHYIKARNVLRQYHQGDVVTFVFASGDGIDQATSSLGSDGHEILGIENRGVTTHVTICKAG